MSLQFILGAAGSGKSYKLYQEVCKGAEKDRAERFFVLVPEQFTLETQKILVEKSKGKGIMNIDVLSFHRLAFRVFEERPALKKPILEDMGKMMMVRKVLSEQKRKLKYFGKGLDSPGFLDELKSFLCEMLLYQVDDEMMERMIAASDQDSLMEYKLQDIQTVYKGFREKLGSDYITAEEILPQLSAVVAETEMLKGSTVCLDGFTGFTPCQVELLRELLKVCKRVIITLTMEQEGVRKSLFELSHKTIHQLTKLAIGIGVTVAPVVWTGKGKEKGSYRFSKNGALDFLEKNIFGYARKIYDREQEEIKICEAKNPRKEAVYVTSEISRLVSEEGYHYGEIAVVTGDLTLYEEYLSTEMSKLGIRYFIDNKRSVGANTFSDFILSFLEMVRRDFDYESTLRFLRGGLSPLSAAATDCLENYVLALGIRGFKSYQREWPEPYNKKRIMDMEQINQSRQKFMETAEAARNELVGGKKTVFDYVRILYSFIVKERIYEKLKEKEAAFEEAGQILLAKEYRSVYSVMMDLFDEMVALLGSEPISLDEFIKLLAAGISEGLIGFVPPSMDQVVVGDVERTRLKDIKILFFIGVNDGIIPSAGKSPGILSQRERQLLQENEIELAPTPREQIFISQFYMYLNLTKASEGLYLSYFRTGSDGGAARPSYLLRKIIAMFPSVKPLYFDESDMTVQEILGTDRGKRYMLTGLAEQDYENQPSEWWELFRYYKEHEPDEMENLYLAGIMEQKKVTKLSQKAADILYGDVLKGSVSRLEQFARCPFSHFVSYGLGLEKRQEYHVEMPDFGNVFHEALENFSDYLNQTDKQWRELEEKEMDDLVEQCVSRVTQNYKGAMFSQSERTNYMVRRIGRIMKRTIGAIALQMKGGKFEQKGFEINFARMDSAEETHLSLKEGKQMDLLGRIDRIDTYETEDKVFVRVIDYKTGSTEFEITSMYYGLQMQLVLYLEAALSLEKRTGKEIVPAGMFYYRISDPMIEAKPLMSNEAVAGEIQKKLSLNGFINGAEEVLDSTGGCFKPGKKAIGTEEEIRNMIAHTRKKMTEFGNGILEGNKEISPAKLGTSEPCGYCEYTNICGFNPQLPEHKYKELPPMDAAEVKEKIKEELEDR